jgi:hypothetical protein
MTECQRDSLSSYRMRGGWAKIGATKIFVQIYAFHEQWYMDALSKLYSPVPQIPTHAGRILT